jgi:hypothetical protein
MLCSFIHPVVTPPLLGLNIPLSTLFSDTLYLYDLNLYSYLHVRDQILHPYKQQVKLW